MGEITNYKFDFKEIVEVLIKKENIHEGIWGIYLEFGIQGANINTTPEKDTFLPAAIVPVVKIGIQRLEKENNLAVDASKINPKPPGGE